MRVLLFLILYFFTSPIIAQEFIPYVLLSQSVDNTTTNSWSGAVYKEDDNNYYVLSCAHGIKKEKDLIQVTLYNSNKKSQFMSIGTKSTFIKANYDYDLAMFSIEKFDRIFKIKPIKFNKNRPKGGERLLVRGYYLGNYYENNVIYEDKDFSNLPIKFQTESCVGEHYSGMSGSPLLNNENNIVGIQLFKNNKSKGGHASLLMIEDFLGEHILSR